jgi:hypothetical protein
MFQNINKWVSMITIMKINIINNKIQIYCIANITNNFKMLKIQMKNK